MTVTVRSIPEIATPQLLGRTVLCMELEPSAHLLLWSARRLVDAGFNSSTVRQALAGMPGAPNRSAIILLRLLLTEVAHQARRPIHLGLPYDQHILMDELMLLAALDRSQSQDALGSTLLLQTLCANDRITGATQATDYLAEALIAAGTRIDVMRFLPHGIVPSIH